MKLGLVLALVVAACVPPPGQSSDTTGGTAATTSSATCDTACARIVECSLAESQGQCVSDCHAGSYDQATIERVTTATCETLASQPAPPGPDDDANYAHSCTAAGIYEVCDGSMCREQGADSMGAGATVEAAQNDAVSACTTHMQHMVISNQMNNQASIKSSCRVTSCK